MQGASADGGGARVAVVDPQDRGAAADLRQAASAAQGVGDGVAVGSVDDQMGVVHHGPGTQGARGAAIAHLQGARVDGGAAAVGVVAGQDLRAGAVFL